MKLNHLIIILLVSVICLGIADARKNSKNRSLKRAMRLVIRKCKREVNLRVCDNFVKRVNRVVNQIIVGDVLSDEVDSYVNMLLGNRPLIERFIINVNDPDLLGVLLQDNFPTLNRNPNSLELSQIANLTSNSNLLKQFIKNANHPELLRLLLNKDMNNGFSDIQDNFVNRLINDADLLRILVINTNHPDLVGFLINLKFPNTDRNLDTQESQHFASLNGNESLIRRLVLNTNDPKFIEVLFREDMRKA